MRISLWSLATLSLTLFGACAQLDDIPSDVCGNNVLEPASSEQCDGDVVVKVDGEGDRVIHCGAAESANACKFTCDSEGVGCPDASDGNGDSIADPWVCGADLRCRQPGTSFASRGHIDRDTAASFDIRDVDGDGRDDIIAKDSNGVVITYGDATRTLGESQRVKSGADMVGPEFIDTNGDGRLDMAYAAPGRASLLLQQNDRQMKPAPQVTIDATSLSPMACAVADYTPLYIKESANISATPVLTFRKVSTGGDVTTKIVVDGTECSNCVLPNSATILDVTSYYRGDALVSNKNYLVVTHSNVLKIFGYSTASPPLLIATIPLPDTVSAPVRVSLNDEKHDGCPDIVVIENDRAFTLFDSPPGVGSSCAIGGTGTLTNFIETPQLTGILDAKPISSEDFTGASIDYLHTSGVYLQVIRTAGETGSSSQIVDRFDNPINSGRFIDYNHDGLDDVAIVSSASVLDLYLNTGSSFNHFAVDLPSAAKAIDVGDVDGDNIDDIILTLEADADDKQAVAVVYGDVDGRLDSPVNAGTYAGPISVRVSRNNRISDISISQNPDSSECSRLITIIPGDTSRTLAASLDLPTNSIAAFVNVSGNGDPRLTYVGSESIPVVNDDDMEPTGSVTRVSSGILGADPEKGLTLNDYNAVVLEDSFAVRGIGVGHVHNTADNSQDLPTLALFTDGYCVPDLECVFGGGAVVDISASGELVPYAVPLDSRLNPYLRDIKTIPPVFLDLNDDGLDDLIWGSYEGDDLPFGIETFLNSSDGFDGTDDRRSDFPVASCKRASLRFDHKRSTSGLVSMTAACRDNLGTDTTHSIIVDTVLDAQAGSYTTRYMEIDEGVTEFRFGDFDGDKIQDFAVMGAANINVYYGCDLIEEADGGNNCVSFREL